MEIALHLNAVEVPVRFGGVHFRLAPLIQQ